MIIRDPNQFKIEKVNGVTVFTYSYPKFTVNIVPEDAYAQTVFLDGTMVPGRPWNTNNYKRTADIAGYGEDTVLYMMEHELFHSVFSHWWGFEVSPVIWSVAHPNEPNNPDSVTSREEEEAVQGFQRHLNEPSYWNSHLERMSKMGKRPDLLTLYAWALIEPLREFWNKLENKPQPFLS